MNSSLRIYGAIALMGAGLSFTGSAAADPAAEQEPKQSLSRQPNVVGPGTQNRVDNIARATDFTAETHAFLRAPMAFSTGTRENPQAGQGGTTFHAPPIVPDYEFGSWLIPNAAPAPWAEILFSYGNKYAAGTVGIGSFNFAATQLGSGATSTVQGALQSMVFGPVFVTLRNPDLMDGRLRLDFNVGSFVNVYGLAGKYDWGKYQTFGIGGLSKAGGTAGAELDVGDWTLRGEQGFGTNNFPDTTLQNPTGTTLIAHTDLFAAQGEFLKFGAHAIHAWSADDRTNPSDATGKPNAQVTILGAEGRANAGVFGEWYLAYSHLDATSVQDLDAVFTIAHANGGQGLIDNFFGRNANGNGKLDNLLFQVDYSVAKLINYPEEIEDGSGPDVTVSLFGLFTSVKTPDADWDGVKKFKYGAEVMYSPLSWFQAGGRFDHIMPRMAESDQSYAVLTPRLQFQSNFITNETITLQYSRYMYGKAAPLAPNVYNNVVGPVGPVPTTGLRYDDDLFYLAATMYW